MSNHCYKLTDNMLGGVFIRLTGRQLVISGKPGLPYLVADLGYPGGVVPLVGDNPQWVPPL